MGRTLPCLLLLAAWPTSAVAQRPDLYDEAVIRTWKLTFHQQNFWQLLFQNRVAKVYIKADLTVDGITYKDVGVRFRGNSAWVGVKGKDKKPFKISLDEFVPKRRLYGRRTLNLNNNFIDPTHLREPLAYWVLRKLVPAPRANFVNLEINSQKWGLYINVEQINKDFLKEWYRSAGGNRYRAEWQPGASQKNSAMQWLGPTTAPYQKAYELKTEPALNPWVDLIHVIDRLNNSGSAIETELPKALDVDNAIRLLAATNLMPWHDSYVHVTPHNYYLYNDAWHGRFALIPWDTNNSFGDYPFQTIRQSMLLDPLFGADRTDRPLFHNVVARPEWRERFFAYFRTALADVYDWATIGAKITAYVKLIAPELAKDPKKLYSMSTFWASLTKDVRVEILVPGLEPFIKGRAAFLRGLAELRKPAPRLADLKRSPARPTVKDPVVVTARALAPTDVAQVRLWWRTRGPFTPAPMFDDGRHGDGRAGDGVFGATIPPQPYSRPVEYYVQAAATPAKGGAWAFLPPYAARTPDGYRAVWPRGRTSVILNEFLAKNLTGVRDQRGELEDWVELCNPTAATVSISGLFLTDDLAVPTRWRIPPGFSLGPGQTLLIWCDGQPWQGLLHASFKLASGGEQIALFARDGTTLLDEVDFGPQAADVSSGRIEDSISPWVTYPDPTPGRPNAPPTCGSRRYSAFDPSLHTIALAISGLPKIGQTFRVTIANAPKQSAVLLFLAALPGDLPLPPPFNFSMLFRTPVITSAPVPTDASGAGGFRVPIPNDTVFAGLRFCYEGIGLLGTALRASNGLDVRLCGR